MLDSACVSGNKGQISEKKPKKGRKKKRQKKIGNVSSGAKGEVGGKVLTLFSLSLSLSLSNIISK